MPRNSDVTEDAGTIAVNTSHNKLQNDEGKFNELIQNVNFILFYLSNVEFQRAQQDPSANLNFSETIQIMWANQFNEWMFKDDLEHRIHMDSQKQRYMNDSASNHKMES